MGEMDSRATKREKAHGSGTAEVKVAAVIPARMASVRFPGKMLFRFHNLPMVEHVRRRALLCSEISEVIVATCDEVIYDVVKESGGKVMMTSVEHKTGIDRIAEVIYQVNCSHVILLQGDEPLILPQDLSSLVDAIYRRPDVKAWNAVAPIEQDADFANHSVIKCVLSESGRILLCSRVTPCVSDISDQKRYVRKILGLMGFDRECLKEVVSRGDTPYGMSEFIEQSRILEYDFALHAVEMPLSYPSVNFHSDVALVESWLLRDVVQREILSRILVVDSRRES